MLFQHTFNMLEQWLSLHPEYGLLATFVVSFIESLAVIGSVVPGSVTMTIVGTMIGSALLPLFPAVMAAFTGAMVGDVLSYYIGFAYQDRVRKWSWIQSHQTWLTQSESFIEKHGMLSVIIGRFFGPMRSMIPMIAGVLKMRPMPFIAAAIPAASLWVIVYLTPGMLLGMFSLELPSKSALHLITGGLLAILAAWLLIQQLSCHRNAIVNQLQHYRHKLATLCTKGTWQPKDPKIFEQKLGALCLGLCLMAVFLFLGEAVSHYHWFEGINRTIYFSFQNMHTHVVNAFMLSMTFLADKYVLSLVVIVLAAMIAKYIDLREAMYLLIATCCSVLIIKGFKMQYHIARPPHMLHILGHTSFPSGHTSYIAFLASYFFMRFKTLWGAQQRTIIRRLVWALIIFIMLTRLYVGAHWLTDVLGGACLGVALAFIAQSMLNPYQGKAKHFPRLVSIVALLTWVMGTAYFAHRHYENYYQNAYGMPPAKILRQKTWLQHPKVLPSFRRNRFGAPQEIFNVQWASPLHNIKNQLTAQDWHIQHMPHTWFGRLMFTLQNPELRFLPKLPMLHQTRPPVLTAYRVHHKKITVVRLWRSHYFLARKRTPIFLGTLYVTKKNGGKLHHHFAPRHYNHALQALQSNQPFRTQISPLTWLPLKRVHWPMQPSPSLLQIYQTWS